MCLSAAASWPGAGPAKVPSMGMHLPEMIAVTAPSWVRMLPDDQQEHRTTHRRHPNYVFLGLQEAVQVNASTDVLPANASTDVKKVTKPAELLPDAGSYYNMANGACLNFAEYGLLIGYGFALVFAAGTMPAGYVCDRSPRVWLAFVSLVAWSVATSMQAAAKNYTGLLACRAVVGLAQAFGTPATVSLAVDYFTGSNQQRDATVALLTMVGPQLGAGFASFSIIFAELMGYRWVVLVTGLCGIALAVVMYATVKEPERTEFTAPCAINVVLEEVFGKSRVARLLIAAASAKMLASYSLAAFLPIWFSRAGLAGYTTNSYACWNALVVSGGGLLATVIGSVLETIWGQHDSRAPCFIGLLGAVVSIPLTAIILFGPNFESSLFCYFLLLVLGDCWFGPTMALAQKAVRRSVRGQAMSMLLVLSSLIGNLGPSLVGVFDSGNISIAANLLWICILGQVLAFVAFMYTAYEISLDPVAAGLGAVFAVRESASTRKPSDETSAKTIRS